MTAQNPPAASPPPASKARLLALYLAQVVSLFGLFGLILFLAAGRTDWREAWLYLGAHFAITLTAGFFLMARDPDLVRERLQASARKNVKTWDRVVILLNMLLTFGLYAVIGLDAGRLGASFVPPIIRMLGGCAILFSFGLTLSASRANTFLSSMVRIQAERGHRTVTSGPYRYIRHPMYAAMCLFDLALPLLLGSWWGLAVGAMMVFLVILRTSLEDRTLQKELAGYVDYAREVRCRLFPGFW